MDKIAPGKRVIVTNKDDDTINSEQFKSFIWRKHDDYKDGQLSVLFKEYGAYMYDVRYEFFEKMAQRAYNPEKYKMLKSIKCETPYEYYDTNMVKVLDKDENEPLYEDRYLYDED